MGDNDIILVGVDDSDTARAAARRAAELAENSGATVHVVTAVDNSMSSQVDVGTGMRRTAPDEVGDGIAASVAEELKQITSRVVAGGPLPGRPAEALVEEAKRLNASLIVVGNRRVQGIGRLLGSVATDVAHHAPCDVYIVKTT